MSVWGAHVWGAHVWGPHVWAGMDTDPDPDPDPNPEPEPDVLAPGKYAPEHASALADLKAAGASPIIFTRADGHKVSGAAIEVRGDPVRYQLAELVLATMPTLLFAPDDYGLRAFTPSFVLPGDRTTWNGIGFVVRDINYTAPDGVVIVSSIVIA